MSYTPITAPVDYVLLAGQRSPGIAEIQGASSPRRWEQRRGYGLSGATVVFRGTGLAQFKLLLRLTTEEQWTEWHAFRPLVQRPPPPNPPSTSTTAQDQLAAFEAAKANDPSAASDPVSQRQLATLQRRAAAEQRRAARPVVRAPRALDIWHPILEDLGIRSVVVEDLLQPVQTQDGEWTIEIRMLEFRAPVFALSRPAGAQQQQGDEVEQRIDRNNQQIRTLMQELAA